MPYSENAVLRKCKVKIYSEHWLHTIYMYVYNHLYKVWCMFTATGKYVHKY